MDNTREEKTSKTSIEEAAAEKFMELIEKHNILYITKCMMEYSEILSQISSLNNIISELDSEKDKDRYMEVVQEIVESTQHYYTYLASLPDDVRKYFLVVSEGRINEDSMSTIKEIVGENVFLDPSPLLSVQSIRPKTYIMHMDNISNHLAELNVHTELDLNVGKNRKTPIHTTVTLDMPDHMSLEGGGTLSTYDKSIINGVTSLLENGNTVFSVAMLYHAMTGKKNPSIVESLNDEITEKLEKMRRIIITIDLTEENEAHYLRDKNDNPIILEDVTLEGYLLPLNKVSGIVNGKRTELFQIIQNPPIYTYSKLKRQLSSIPIFLLDAPINNNSTTIPLKTYLLQRIEMMKNKNNKIKSHVILYESVYSEISAADANKTKKMRIRNYTTKILDYLAESGYISSFKEFKKGRSIAGIELKL